MTATLQTNWKAKAKEAIQAGYQAGNPWERMLEGQMNRCCPQLVRDLGSDLQPYLQVRTSDAMDQEELMLDQGTDPQIARELALTALLEVPLEEEPDQD